MLIKWIFGIFLHGGMSCLKYWTRKRRKLNTRYLMTFLTCFRNGQIVPSAVSMNDYRLLRLSWIYDMNFPATFALILKHDYLPKILAKIPPSNEKDEIAGIILEYVTRRSKE